MPAPSKFAHVVYQTHRFEEMVDWYIRVFEATIRHKDDKLAFLFLRRRASPDGVRESRPRRERSGAEEGTRRRRPSRRLYLEGSGPAHRHLQALEELRRAVRPTDPPRPHAVALLSRPRREHDGVPGRS